jgi:Tol biopolymer transport system component
MLGCQDTPNLLTPPGQDALTPPVLSTIIVSNPDLATAGPAPFPSRGTPFTGQVFVSLPPGSLADGKTIAIESHATGARITCALVDGGLDPVPISAVPGDTLDLAITTQSGSDTQRFIALVPLLKPPVIVRTDPPPAKRDVPLNAVMILVFSEPIKPSTLTGAALQLLLNGSPVAGTTAFADPANLVAAFTPASPLLPGTTYQLLATQGIQAISGESLAAPVAITITTDTSALPAPSPRIAFASDRDGGGSIYVVDPDGTGLVNLGSGGEPAWSWDGSRIAFADVSLDQTTVNVLVMNRDGSNRVRLGEGWSPAWSPDGTQIVFSVDTAIMLMNSNGSNRRKLVNLQIPGMPAGSYRIRNPVWSPDGQSIVFGSYGGAAPIYEQIFRMGADGSNPRVISSDPWTKQSPAWSPSGDRLAAFSWDDYPGYPGAYENVLAIYDLSTGQRTVHYRMTFPYLANGLDVSPDGRYVLFTRAFSTMEQYGYRLMLLDLQTDSVTPLLADAKQTVNPNYFDLEPVWSRR